MTRNTSQDPEYEGLPYHEKKFHKDHFGGVDMSHLKPFRDNSKVWVRVGNVQKLMKREEAIAQGYKIPSQKRNKRRRAQRGGN